MKLFKSRICIIISIALVIIMSFFVSTSFGMITIDGTSMEPALKNHDIRVVFLRDRIPSYDVFVLGNPEGDGYIVKRILGLPSDDIEFKNGLLYRNGILIEEPYIDHRDYFNAFYHVPEGCVFVAGDNRQDSYDSRFYQNPFIPITNIYGKVFC